jgi:hypothetical protein
MNSVPRHHHLTITKFTILPPLPPSVLRCMTLHDALLRGEEEVEAEAEAEAERRARRARGAAAGPSAAGPAADSDGVAARFAEDADDGEHEEYVSVKKRRLQETEGRYRRLGRTGAAPAREHEDAHEEAPQVRPSSTSDSTHSWQSRHAPLAHA